MVRRPSVPLDYLYNYSNHSRTKILSPRPLPLTRCPLVMSDCSVLSTRLPLRLRYLSPVAFAQVMGSPEDFGPPYKRVNSVKSFLEQQGEGESPVLSSEWQRVRIIHYQEGLYPS